VEFGSLVPGEARVFPALTLIGGLPLIPLGGKLTATTSTRRGIIKRNHPRRGRRQPQGLSRATHVTGAHRDAHPQLYEIRVRGRLGETICSAFPDLQARPDSDDTVLAGMLADQAALYGVLAEIEALGLELIEVRRLPPRDEPQAPSS
jgi:hypothetical protein